MTEQKPPTKQLFGCDGTADPFFCYNRRGHRHGTEELFGACESFDDQVSAFVGLHADPSSQFRQRLLKTEAVNKRSMLVDSSRCTFSSLSSSVTCVAKTLTGLSLRSCQPAERVLGYHQFYVPGVAAIG